jgi:hypothetical protein
VTTSGTPAQACPTTQTRVSRSAIQTTQIAHGSPTGQQSCSAQFRPHGSAAKRRMYFLHAMNHQHVHGRRHTLRQLREH